ncbi:hypothetical protein CsSME_00000353 [Camellia sinensis var. sinensis]
MKDASDNSHLEEWSNEKNCAFVECSNVGSGGLVDYTNEKGKFDELVEGRGVKILIDPKARMHVIGTKMDFFNDKLRSEFIFINPNPKGKCGCGESFMPTSSAEAAKPVIVQDHKS